MSSVSGVPKQQVGKPTEAETTKGNPKFSGTRSAPLQAKITQPTLDDKHRFLMDGKDDKVKQLLCITVKFYPGNLQEITYQVETGEGEIEEMSTSQFQDFRARLKRSVAKEEEMKAAKGFLGKLQKRTLLTFTEEPDIGRVREIQARKMPGPGERIMSLTQELYKQKEFGDPSKVLTYWNGMPENIKAKMDEFQVFLDPHAGKWTDRLNLLIQEENERLEQAALKKAKKLVSKTPTTKPLPSAADGLWAEAEEESTKHAEEETPDKGETDSKQQKEEEEEKPQTVAPDQPRKKGAISSALSAGAGFLKKASPSNPKDKEGKTNSPGVNVVTTTGTPGAKE